MGSTAVTAQEYWGYLIKPDKNPTPVFEQLLLGVANYIVGNPLSQLQRRRIALTWASSYQNHHIAPWDVHCLTPAKLAAFYRLVGGDYDPLFLDTPQSSLSFIYQSLGCFHTLQPEQDPYASPTIPALTPQGFVRWQTVQLLLGPEEHVPFLQEAVKRFDLLNPADGIPFPSLLPKEALPVQPDPDLSEWHDAVTQKLMLEAQASAARDLPPRPQMALSDIDLESSRDSSVDSRSVAGTDIAGYFRGPRAPYHPSAYSSTRAPNPPPHYPSEAPWSPERRRNSLPDNNRGYPASWPRNGDKRTSFPPPPPRNTRLQHHTRGDSDLSTISTSTSDSSSITNSSASLSPVRYHTHLQPPTSPGGRRHSTNVPPQRPASHPQGYAVHQRQSSGPSSQKNVRWQEMDDVLEYTPSSLRGNERYGRDLKRGYGYGDGRVDERGRGRAARSVGPNVGVGGRRYADGAPWR